MFSAKLGGFVRWLFTWPILVIVALNLENIAQSSGYDTIISENKQDVWPVFVGLYAGLTSPWVWYPTIFLCGVITYEWVLYFSDKMEKDGSKYQRRLLKTNANNSSQAYAKAGFYRRNSRPEKSLVILNRQLESFGLASVPFTFESPEEVNRIYGTYLFIVAKGEFEHANLFIKSMSKTIRAAMRERQLPSGIAAKTQP